MWGFAPFSVYMIVNWIRLATGLVVWLNKTFRCVLTFCRQRIDRFTEKVIYGYENNLQLQPWLNTVCHWDKYDNIVDVICEKLHPEYVYPKMHTHKVQNESDKIKNHIISFFVLIQLWILWWPQGLCWDLLCCVLLLRCVCCFSVAGPLRTSRNWRQLASAS